MRLLIILPSYFVLHPIALDQPIIISLLNYCCSLQNGLPVSSLSLCNPFFHIETKENLIKCKSEHVTSLLEFLQRFPTNFRIKSQIFSKACKVLYNHALLASSASSLPPLAQTLLLDHIDSRLPDAQALVHLSAFARAFCSAWNALPHHHLGLSTLLTPLHSFTLSFLSKFLPS